MNPLGPLIVQSDKTALLEVANPLADEARHALATFAELERAPEHIHTYRITRLGLWNARAAGHTTDDVLGVLDTYAKFPVPDVVTTEIRETMRRYGALVLVRSNDDVLLTGEDSLILMEVVHSKRIAPLLDKQLDDHTWKLLPWSRGQLKQELLRIGWPAADEAGYTDGEEFPMGLTTNDWELRPYQHAAIDRFMDDGSGVIVLPCGAGKTIVGAGAMTTLSRMTLILVTNIVSARQWRRELLERTSLTEDDVGEYSGEMHDIRPVTIATYQILTAKRKGEFRHLALLNARDWGLIIYDEVHLLPAPVFKLTADLQSRRRLGLTATLVREDGRENDVFSLIGPKRFDAPWKDLEADGYIAPARCVEVRVDLSETERLTYASAADQDRYRIAASSNAKLDVVRTLIDNHAGESILIIGQYLDQLHHYAEALDLPLITGETPQDERTATFDAFRDGTIKRLLVSKVANFSVDLPDASVAIQVSGAFGSRQEEAQRLGRIVRPKADGLTATFYTIVARDTIDQDYALHRQRFLAEQGYRYDITDSVEHSYK